LPGPFHPLVERSKAILGPIVWSIPDSSDGAVGFLAPLDVDGVTIEGFFLRGKAYEQSPDKDVMFQLEVAGPGARTRTPLRRIEWLPRSPLHKNPDKTMIFGSHEHPFEINWLEDMQRMRSGNLPWAEEVPKSISSYSRLLDFTANRFRIGNMNTVPVPEWSAKLF